VDQLSDWNELYQKENVENLPWYSPKLDHDLKKTLEKIKPSQKIILNMGEGPGTQAIALAKMGYRVTATDISEAAIEKAKKLAGKENVNIDFIVDDITRSKLKKKFPMIFDRGVFHVLPPKERENYVKIVHNLLDKDGILFLKCFSWKETRPGPHRFRPEEIREMFSKHFNIESIKETYFEGSLEDFPKALFVIMRKK